jgi:hypothetical protein
MDKKTSYRVVNGDISKKKMVIVAWKKVCVDYEERGLGVKSLVSFCILRSNGIFF